jgi:hypothetical protein
LSCLNIDCGCFSQRRHRRSGFAALAVLIVVLFTLLSTITYKFKWSTIVSTGNTVIILAKHVRHPNTNVYAALSSRLLLEKKKDQIIFGELIKDISWSPNLASYVYSWYYPFQTSYLYTFHLNLIVMYVVLFFVSSLCNRRPRPLSVHRIPLFETIKVTWIEIWCPYYYPYCVHIFTCIIHPDIYLIPS